MCEPLKAALTGALTRPRSLSHLKVAPLLPKLELIQSLVLFLLVADVLSDHRLVSTHRGYKISPGPEALPDEVALPLPVHPRQMNRALPLDVTDDLRDRVLGRDRNHHVHVIGHQMPFL